jgi:hypothetical protein
MTHQTTIPAYEITTGELLYDIALISAVGTVDSDIEVWPVFIAGGCGWRSSWVGLHVSETVPRKVYTNSYRVL